MSTQPYRNIVKGTAVFGGVQVFNIIINLLRGKFIALLLGSTGMGISALLTSTMNILIQVANLGLNLSAVREIAQSQEEADHLGRIICIFRRLLLGMAVIGGAGTIIMAPQLSLLAFGNRDYTWSFVLLAAMLFFTVLSNGETAILQGMRRFKQLAVSTAIGAATGLLVGTPLYYWFGIAGIAPAMVVLALSMFLTQRYHTRRLRIRNKEIISIRKTFEGGRSMIGLGIAQMVSVLLGMLGIYLVNTFISHTGNIEDVGLFQAAASITNQYIGFVFSAMAVDYFPRLVAVCDDPIKSRRTVNNQAEIILLISVPIILALIITTPLVIRLLLTREFLPIIPVLRWMGLGLLFKALSFPLGYMSYAKGDKKTFFWLEGVYANMLIAGCNIVSYMLWGLLGLGISSAAAYLLYLLSVIIITRFRYGFRFNSKTLRLIPVSAALSITMFLLFLFHDGWVSYLFGSCLLALSMTYSYHEINKRTAIGAFLRDKLRKKTS